MVAESSGRTFGEAFGALVRRKRKVAGLNQNQLAEDAFGTSAKVRRISELENGLVANPQPKTIDPLISVLAITHEELEACLADTPWQPDPELERAFREARALIEGAAARFELARPHASLAEIEDHLREKALEWQALRARRVGIPEGVHRSRVPSRASSGGFWRPSRDDRDRDARGIARFVVC